MKTIYKFVMFVVWAMLVVVLVMGTYQTSYTYQLKMLEQDQMEALDRIEQETNQALLERFAEHGH